MYSREKVWVVLHLYGDYIGWFDGDVLEVFDNEKDANNFVKTFKIDQPVYQDKIEIIESFLTRRSE